MWLGGRNLGKTLYAAIILTMNSVLLTRRTNVRVLAKRQVPMLRTRLIHSSSSSSSSAYCFPRQQHVRRSPTALRLVRSTVIGTSSISWSSAGRAPFLTLQRHFLSGFLQSLRGGGVEAVQNSSSDDDGKSPATNLSRKTPDHLLGTFPVSVCSIRGVYWHVVIYIGVSLLCLTLFLTEHWCHILRLEIIHGR